MHELKNLVHLLLTPLMLALMLAAFGLILRVFRLRRAAFAMLMLAVGVGYLGSTSLVGDALLGPLSGVTRRSSSTRCRAMSPMWWCWARGTRPGDICR